VRAPLWNDELYTWYVAQLPTMGDVWDTLETGVEQIPPLYYVATRASLALFGDNQVALRVPSLLGFLLASSCLFAAIARRTNAWYGLVAALIPLASGAAPYAWEARPYALVLGFAAAAVLCYQLRADGIRPGLAVVGLALALAAATAFHYYGALVVVPIALAEIVRRRMRGRLDRAVVAALFAPVVPLAVALPLLREARRYAGAFWTDFDLGSAPEFSVFLLRAEVFSASRIPTWLGIGFAALVVGGALVVLLRRPRAAQVEVGAAIGFVLLPLVGVVVGELATGAYVERYVLSAVIGPALLVPLALHRLAAGRQVAALATAAVLVVWFSVLFQYWHRDAGVDGDRRERLEAFVEQRALPLDLPVAVAHPHDYLELAHDAPDRIASRLVRLSDPERALRYTGSRSTEDGLVVLAGFAPLHLVPYEEQRTPFLLLRTIRGEAEDWIDEALDDDGARAQLVARDQDDGFTLVRVEPAGGAG
jgi:mannosyltransferase